jgi:nucleotide-binding universal stress UspA family protein
MEPLKPRLIVVPTDFSAPAAHALRYASSLAERFGAHLLVIYADTFMVPVDFTATAVGAFDLPREAMIEEAREQLEGHAEQCISAGVPYEVRVVVDAPVAAITDQVRGVGANLIVMGTHGRTGMRRLLMGSVTEAVIRVASVPVLAVSPRTPETASIAKVLCPVNYTPACAEVLRRAAALTDTPTSPLLVVRGVDERSLGLGFDEMPRLHAWVPPELVDRCELKLLAMGSPVEQIVGLARETHAGLIALGVSTDRSIVDEVRGTLAERIVQHSGCPVLTVNGFAARALQTAEKAPALAAAE